ncbi:hypothetical protein TNCV_2359401 [Trichonephila clavipes]|nr:hypothetical protein TNCV_2359401 [Trichonephila clavipes]
MCTSSVTVASPSKSQPPNSGYRSLSWHYFPRWNRFNSCQVIYSQFGFGNSSKNDHQTRRDSSNGPKTIAVVPDFHKRILFSDEAHFLAEWLRQQTKLPHLSEANPQVYVKHRWHPEKLTVWCALWAGESLFRTKKR